MNRPQSIPANYIETEPGVWVHPSRLPHTALKDAIGACEIHKQAANLRVDMDYAEKVRKFGQGYVNEFCGPPPKRIRQSSKPLMNKLEREFQGYYEVMTGHKLVPQSIKFMLGNGIWYKPDFVLWCATMGMKCLEIKGPHAFRGGFENLKVAASKYPQVSWELWWKQDGKWEHQSVFS